MPRHILFVHSGADLYGSSRSLSRLCARLVKDNNLVTCILPYDGPLVPLLAASGVSLILHDDLASFSRAGVRTLKGRLLFLAKCFSSTLRIMRIIRSKRVDVVHSNTSVIPSAGLAAFLAGRPHVWHIRESFAEFRSLWIPYRAVMTMCSRVTVCVSAAVADQFPEKTRGNKTRVIHNGLPGFEFQPIPPERIETFRKKYGLNGGLIVGVFGRIKFERKGQEVLVEAAALLKERFPNLKLLIVGTPFPGNEDHFDRLMKLVKALDMTDRVIFTGDMEETAIAYSALDIFVLPSCQPEPFGGVVIEAMAMGKPVIGTRIGGTVEQIDHGRTGLLVNPGDPTDLRNALEELLSNEGLREEMGKRGRERYLNLFEFELFYSRITDLYRELLSNKENKFT